LRSGPIKKNLTVSKCWNKRRKNTLKVRGYCLRTNIKMRHGGVFRDMRESRIGGSQEPRGKIKGKSRVYLWRGEINPVALGRKRWGVHDESVAWKKKSKQKAGEKSGQTETSSHALYKAEYSKRDNTTMRAGQAEECS